jgi:hypothetical protein
MVVDIRVRQRGEADGDMLVIAELLCQLDRSLEVLAGGLVVIQANCRLPQVRQRETEEDTILRMQRNLFDPQQPAMGLVKITLTLNDQHRVVQNVAERRGIALWVEPFDSRVEQT